MPKPKQIFKTAENLGVAAMGVGAAILVATNPTLRRRLAQTVKQSALESLRELGAHASGPTAATAREGGVVYLLQAGQFFKIGKASHFERRKRQIDLQLPFEAREIHQIRCDEISRVERYWHQRFASKRRNGEWFVLGAADVAEFQSYARM